MLINFYWITTTTVSMVYGFSMFTYQYATPWTSPQKRRTGNSRASVIRRSWGPQIVPSHNQASPPMQSANGKRKKKKAWRRKRKTNTQRGQESEIGEPNSKKVLCSAECISVWYSAPTRRGFLVHYLPGHLNYLNFFGPIVHAEGQSHWTGVINYASTRKG